MARQQLKDASEAAQQEKEAAVSKTVQSVQRRASKEALHQVPAFTSVRSPAWESANVCDNWGSHMWMSVYFG